MSSTLPHLMLPGPGAAVLLAVASGDLLLQGQTCGYFDSPVLGIGDAGVAPDGSSAFVRIGHTRAQTMVLFEHHRFSGRGTAQEPFDLGKITMRQEGAVHDPVGTVARLNLNLFLAAPRPCVVELTRIALPLGWAPAAADARGSAEHREAVLIGGHLVHVAMQTVPTMDGTGERLTRQGAVTFTFAPEQADRPLHARILLRTCRPARTLQWSSAA